ncbi:hypothetical protein BGY98DRAFT_1175756 [Russula aff. rugulosa BPL654]|nr:hypothetical protein BGY98DRAFT_1175756 [Russula aff. rugulosa BPL654]
MNERNESIKKTKATRGRGPWPTTTSHVILETYYFLDALDEELPTVLAPISVHQSAYSALANFIETFTTRIFGEKSRSLVRAQTSPTEALQKTGDHSISISSTRR